MRTPFCNLQLTIILTCIPPLSSLPAIPSTSSIISTCFLGSALWPDKAQRVQLQRQCRLTFPFAFFFQTDLASNFPKGSCTVSNIFPKFPLSSTSTPHPSIQRWEICCFLQVAQTVAYHCMEWGGGGWGGGVGAGAKPYFPLFKSANYQKGSLE